MAGSQHVLERRATLLATKLRGRVESIKGALVPAGARVPFTEQLSKPDALRWWQANIDSPDGQKVLAQMDPLSVIQLRTALGKADQAAAMPEAPPMGGADGV